MNRPDSPNTLLEDAKEGGDLIKKDWEVTKLKKRVDANEEGIERLNNLLESLAKQMKNLEDKQIDTVNPVGKIFIIAVTYTMVTNYIGDKSNEPGFRWTSSDLD